MKKNTGEKSSQIQLRLSQPVMPAPPMNTRTTPAPSPAVSRRLPG
jgi:hypothetical protein